MSHANAAQKDIGWDPARTWIFAVGVLHWKHSEMFGSFPVEERRDAEFVDFFKQHGVPADHIVYLQDEKGTQKRIDAAFVDALKKVGQDDLLIVYYAGHGSKSENGKDVYLASYDAGDKDVPGWSVNSIPKTIGAKSACQRVLWFIDCCYSGQAARAIANSDNSVAYACVTSSSASESSTGHWTFTEALLDALRGIAYVDLNHDGAITLAEFASHAHADMALGEEQLSTFATTNGFDRQMILSRAPPLENARVGERGQIEWHGDWWPVRVIEENRGKLKVHYIGYSGGDDLWVAPEKLRPVKPLQYAPGSKVDVLWKKKWYPATVLKVEDGIHLIHYTDYDSSWDEWVASKRIRKARS
ncbi:MAG TPA: agenet domain-containing protein [Chthoniobacterales bacterium]|nr:agenet domain-containing protein [Chthoniobacterales bacterium]